jgi:hypothetical protein
MRLLKFDSLHPLEYLSDLKEANMEKISKMSLNEYRQWLISTRMNFSDFYSYNLGKLGWESEEFFLNDLNFQQKVEFYIFGSFVKIFKIFFVFEKLFLVNTVDTWKEKVIQLYVSFYKPDVIFIREHSGVNSQFWHRFRNKALVINRISAALPKNWSPYHFDYIYTDVAVYKKLFKLNQIKYGTNSNGFDVRLLNEVTRTSSELNDVIFIGGLGYKDFSIRTQLMRELAINIDSFLWWGYKQTVLDDILERKWCGVSGGIEMFNLISNSRIVINDYIDIAEGEAVNQRLYEVMGIGGALLLTRECKDLVQNFPFGTHVTFNSVEDCIDKIQYYLTHELERVNIVNKAQTYILENFTYSELMVDVSRDILSIIEEKRKG